jgi:hypothetical protein
VPPTFRAHRPDTFFELGEIVSWMQALPRMQAHILDAGHKLLETHSTAAVALMLDFIKRSQVPAPMHRR